MNGTNRAKGSMHFIYTYHLPYGVRRDICNLLDADQSWRTLGGQFIGLDATQLTLIGQAYLRNGSPTEDLLNKLDSANLRISELCLYLRQMNHCRALEILRPYMISHNSKTAGQQDSAMLPPTSAPSSTLYTPTPSFATIPPAALMGANRIEAIDYQLQQQSSDWYVSDQLMQDNNNQMGVQSSRMGGTPTHFVADRSHKMEESTNYARQQQQHDGHLIATQQLESNNLQRKQYHSQQKAVPDPGEEIVRLACANNRKRTSISDQEVVNQLRLIMQINYNELKQASNNFSDSNILGNGGFASVYRGHWKGTDVAIKRLRCNLMDQALNELTILNSYRIDNILPIYGISIDGPEACLVYQFMANGSLEDRLSCKNGTPALTWNQRALIGEGVAKGLYYLHTLRDKPLVHGDVKSANVLLDAQFVPKLGDFGLARQVFKGKKPQAELCTHCTVSSIHGTSVYLPPEYLRHKILSPAVDVYSYGIVLLEMATGKRAYDGKRLLIDLVEDETRSMSLGQIGYSLKDPRLSNDTQNDLKIWFELLIKLGINCAHKIKKKRPDIGQILNHFSSFRLNAGVENMGTDNLKNGLFISNGSTTAQTLTPGFTTLDKTKQNDGAHKKSGIEKQLPANNSALMSFEEEESEHGGGQAGNVEQQQQQLQPGGNAQQTQGAVDAMIPLLTELGIASQQN